MIKKVKKLITLLVVSLLLFTACSGGVDSGSSAKGGEVKQSLIFASDGDAVILDPQFNGDTGSQRVTTNIFDNLVREKEGTIVSAIAESWTVSDDGMTYSFKLREDITYHDGTKLTAKDIKFTMDRAMTSPHAAELVECVESTVVSDDYNVTINMAYPYGPFLVLLAAPQLAIVNEEIYEAAGEDFGRHPVGCGPYKFVQWDAGDKIVLKAFDNYFGGKPAIENVTFKVIADKSSGLIALENGEIDVLLDVAAIDADRVKNSESLTFYEAPALRSNYISFNCENTPFDNVLVRQAIAHCIDKEAILYAAEEGVGQIAKNHIAEKAFGFTDEVGGYPVDVEKAKALLTEAGYPDGFDTKIMVSNPDAAKMAQVIQTKLLEAGINCEIEQYEWGTFLDMGLNGDYSMMISGWGYLAADADQGLYAITHSSQIGGANFSRYSNARMDELLEIGRTSSSEDERLSAYKEITEIMREDAPTIPFYWTVTNIGANKELKGVKAHPMTFYNIAELSW